MCVSLNSNMFFVSTWYVCYCYNSVCVFLYVVCVFLYVCFTILKLNLCDFIFSGLKGFLISPSTNEGLKRS